MADDLDHGAPRPPVHGQALEAVEYPERVVRLAGHTAVYECLGQQLTGSFQDSRVGDAARGRLKDDVAAGVAVAAIREGLIHGHNSADGSEPRSIELLDILLVRRRTMLADQGQDSHGDRCHSENVARRHGLLQRLELGTARAIAQRSLGRDVRRTTMSRAVR
ncbi:MAG: hypothetical protein E6K82_05105 [Candidatus Rokuibacteriota bacterium]|nr:MAG: hypothetical protein E6K82_05105 [Candidatus Rokubacteria bacterium]